MNLRTRKRALGAAALAGTAGLLLAACGAAPDDTSEGDGAEDVDFLACAVSDEGSWEDKSFNEAAMDGLEQAESELGVEIQGFESATSDDFGPNLQAAVDADCDIIFAVGFNFSWEGSLERIATENPDVHFAWIDGWELTDNIKPITYTTEQSSYLAGYVSAAYSETGTVATYGGQEIDSVTIFMDGFKNGALQYGEDSGEDITVLPYQYVGDFDSTDVAQSISDAFLADGADVIFPVAGGLFTATDAAIEASGDDAVFIGVDKDIAVTQPDMAAHVLTSVEKRMTQAVYDVIDQLVGGEEFSTEAYVGTLENDGTGLSDFHDFDSEIPDEIKTKLEELTQGIIDGSIDPLAAP